MTLSNSRHRPPRLQFGAGFLVFGLVFGLAFLVSCNPSQREVITLPPTPPISGNLGWILVKEAYARVKAGASESLEEVGHLRDGSVLNVEARDYGPAGDGSTILWYRVNGEGRKGWVSSRQVEVYSSRLQAEAAQNTGGTGQ
ncbi:MAG: SH3 domain-containing protein [Rectinemataceae bacterium]